MKKVYGFSIRFTIGIASLLLCACSIVSSHKGPPKMCFLVMNEEGQPIKGAHAVPQTLLGPKSDRNGRLCFVYGSAIVADGYERLHLNGYQCARATKSVVLIVLRKWKSEVDGENRTRDEAD